MRKDWNKIVGRLLEDGIAVNIITNGFVFSEDILKEIKRLNIESIAVSLDGPREVHDKYRQEGSFDRAVKALEVLCENGIHTSVISTLNSENAQLLNETYEILKKYQIFAWQLQACSPMGNAANGGIAYRFDMGEVIRFVEENMRTAPFAMGVADNIGYFTSDEGSIRGNMSGVASFRGCSAGIDSIGIDSVGNIRGCESMYDECFNEGNIRSKSLREIWENPDGFAYNRKFSPEMLTGKCAECEMGMYCAGGCRSYNHFVHGKLYESPFCARVQ